MVSHPDLRRSVHAGMSVPTGRSVTHGREGGAGVEASGRPAGSASGHHRGQWPRILQPDHGRLILPPRHLAGLYSARQARREWLYREL